MELQIGSHVRENGHRIGRLAGFELEPGTPRIRRIIFSMDGELGPKAMTRPLRAVTPTHAGGDIELRTDGVAEPMPIVRDVILLSHHTVLVRPGRAPERLVALDVNQTDRSVLSVIARRVWWSRRVALAARPLDFSNPGEIRG